MTSSMYTLASTQSQFSNAVDNWIRGAPAITTVGHSASAAVQDSRAPIICSTHPGTLCSSGIWYLLAMVLPLFSGINTSPRFWGCSPSTILNAAELLAGQIGQIFACIRHHVRRIAQDQVARDIFATAMDVILIVYALGFLLLSMYQASVFN